MKKQANEVGAKSTPELLGALERAYHEPNRLGIMSELAAAAPKGVPFTALKAALQLTDGNLSRHLKTLEEARAVRVEKAFQGVKPVTTVFMTDKGSNNFLQYLKALEEVLHQAAKAAAPQRRPSRLKVTTPKTA